MFTRSVLLVLLLLGCLQSVGATQNAKGPAMCCFSFFRHRIPLNKINVYTEAMSGCMTSGIVFTLKNGNRVCVDPYEGWVRRAIEKIDQRLLKIAKLQPSGQNPSGSV